MNIIPFIENESNDYEYYQINKDYNNNDKQYTSKKKYISNILFLFVIIFILILSFHKQQIFNNDDIDYENVDITNIPQIINKKKKDNLNEKIIPIFNYYMNICQKGILLDNKKYNLTKSPKISVIISLYNGGKYLKYSLRSIQNQKLKDIEIIIVNDHSTDNSLEIIKSYMDEDPRIRLINNEKNRRILYSKSIGALFANGQYIIGLDQDDMFITDIAFSSLYNESKKNNIDLIQFQDFVLKEFRFKTRVNIEKSHHWIKHHEDTYLEQPEIKNLIFNEYNFLIWGLFIKSEIYERIVRILWPIIINYKLVHYEDYHITFLMTAHVNNFMFMNKYFMVHLDHKSAGNDKEFRDDELISRLFFMNSMMDYLIRYNPNDIFMINNFILHQKNTIKKYKKYFKNMFNFVIKKIYEYLSYDQKILYRDKYGIKGFKINNTYEYFTNLEEYNKIISYEIIINTSSQIYNKSISLHPKFSIVLYSNETKFLQKTLNSIEKQNFDNYEIILIYDNYGNIDEINEIIKYYNNLVLILNKDYKGLLYSYSKAILKSKGEYILTFKLGYTFATNDVLNKLNEYLNDKSEDILEFNLLINNKESIYNNSLKLYKCSHFESEINIDSLLFNKNYIKIDQEKELIINKLIKSNIYKTIINEYLYLYKNYILSNYFDEIILFLLKQKNVEIKHININGIIEYSPIANPIKLFIDMNDTTKIIEDSFFYINYIFDHSKDEENDKLFVLNEFYNILNILFNKKNDIPIEGRQLINKFLDCKCIPQYNKNLLRTYYNALIDRNKYDLLT